MVGPVHDAELTVVIILSVMENLDDLVEPFTRQVTGSGEADIACLVFLDVDRNSSNEDCLDAHFQTSCFFALSVRIPAVCNLNELACMMERNLASFHQMLASQMATAVHPARVIRPISSSPTAETDAIVVLGVRSLLFIQGLTLPERNNPTLYGGVGTFQQSFDLGTGPNFRHC